MGAAAQPSHCQHRAGLAIQVFAKALEEQAVEGFVSVRSIEQLYKVMVQAPGALAEHYSLAEKTCTAGFVLSPPDADEAVHDGDIEPTPAVASRPCPSAPGGARGPSGLAAGAGDAVQGRRGAVSSAYWVAMAAGAAALTMVSWLLTQWSGGTSTESTTLADARMFTSQVLDAASDSGEVRHLFGGQIKVVESGGRIVVVAENIPPRVCGASGWTLARKGLLTINGITPNRLSRAIVIDLCGREGGGANLMWIPKTVE